MDQVGGMVCYALAMPRVGHSVGRVVRGWRTLWEYWLWLLLGTGRGLFYVGPPPTEHLLGIDLATASRWQV